MVDLVLHPGHSKCGSTTIQDFIYNNRVVFRQRGIFLPDVNFNFPNNKQYQFQLTQTPRDYLAKIQSGEVNIAELETKLDQLISTAEEQGCRRVIISAENLINAISSEKTKSIHELFNRKFSSVRVVYYIRKQDSLFVSAWQQWGHKAGESLDSYIKKMSKTKFGDFLFIARHLRKYYPEQMVKVFPLNRKYLVKENLLFDFCSRSQINVNNLNMDIQDSNSGLSSAMCHSLSRINEVYSDIHDQKVKEHITELCPNSDKLLNTKYRHDLSRELTSLLYDKFQESNELLAKRYFPKIPFDEVLSLKLLTENSDETAALYEKIQKLEDLTALQMDMILTLRSKMDKV
ncbi:hypothetical protein [Shewanella sp. TC10]|uniref:hypothetical protein n=1 Tax=Shewanella sp. TC10 TaxID=1419739 RepID=UPI00129E5DA6|nr:hypothetical protein [Shewanella sp. TC10]